MKDWAPLASTGYQPGMARPGTPPGGRVQCVECGRMFAPEDVIAYRGSYVCGSCKNVFFQRVREGGAAPGEFTYGGFWIRFGAKFLDGIIMSVINFVVSFAFGLVLNSMAQSGNESAAMPVLALMYIVTYGVQIGYYVFFVGRFGATPGKMAAGLKIVRPDGDRVTYLRALGRYFAEILSSLILLMGYIMAAFDDEKRALHDRICDTRVIRIR
jgi:uncharacterized RDD family membrane protein YckC